MGTLIFFGEFLGFTPKNTYVYLTFLKWEEEKRVGETGKDIRCIELISFLLLYLSTTSFYLKREVAKIWFES